MISYCPDLVVICESWLKPAMPDSLFHISNYSLYRKDRLVRKGGGVAIYVCNKYTCKTVPLPSGLNVNFELICVLCSNPVTSDSYLLIAVYHPPRALYSNCSLIDALTGIIDFLSFQYPDTLIFLAGDLKQLDTTF